MAITVLKEAANTIIGNTEWSMSANTTGVSANTTDGIFQIFVDAADLVTGEALTLKVYEKVWSAGTQRAVYSATLVDGQIDPVWVSPSLILMNGWDMTANLTQGTSTYLQWSIRQVG